MALDLTSLQGGFCPLFIAQEIEYEPLDQTDFTYGWDVSLEAIEEYSKSSWWLPTIGSQAAQGWAWLAPPGRLSSPASVWSPQVSSGTLLCIRHKIIPWYLLIFRSSLAVFCVNPAENINSPKLMKIVSNNLLLYCIYPFWSFMKEKLTVHGIL
jgi:hypothetical protein